MSTNLFILQKIEAITGTKLEKISVDDIFSQKSGFAVDENENIIGLNLDSLKLTDISFLKNLTGLKELILKRNQINDINILRNLDSLTVLDLSENEISDVSCLKDLFHLRRLYLDFNQIIILPKEIALLTNLEYLSLNGNPLASPPYRDANAGLESIRKYFKKHPGFELPSRVGETKEYKPADRKILTKVKRKKIFISYSHFDKKWLMHVQKHLHALVNDWGDIPIEVWDDTQIKAGMRWKKEIKKALSEAKIAVLLISTDFLASDFIRNNELPHLLTAAREDGTVILPLIIKPSRFERSKSLSQFKAHNLDEPLYNLKEGNRDKILDDLIKDIEKILSIDDVDNKPDYENLTVDETL